MDKAESVRVLIRKHFWEMPDEACLTTGKMPVLPEDAEEFLNEYAETLSVDMTGFSFNRYFPNEGIRFLPNAILPKYLRTEHHSPAPLTVGMLIAAAEAGYWIDK
ncbi:DUF1493 family protein [Erwinia sp. E_sp_B04_7]|uniref:DUF1493 family protein n=1 Tax=unclassified Erwinia TaxID=2622719 RepID=UPI0030D13EA0